MDLVRYAARVLRNAIFAAFLAVASCRHHPAEPATTPASTEPSTTQTAPPVQGPAVVLRPQGAPPVTVRVEVQRNEAERERGLMFRQTLDELAGMIFVFPQPDHQVFWMRNTYLPLDMVFITADRRVLGVVRNATPMTDDPREVPGDCLYVLEVNAGFADRHHITNGTLVDLVGIPPALE